MKLRQSKDYVYIDDGHFSIGVRLEWLMTIGLDCETLIVEYHDGDVRKIHFKNTKMANNAYNVLCEAWNREM